MSKTEVTILGAGLAGSEAAWQLARRGIPVRLLEMKPAERTEAHDSPYFAELVCSNSLRSEKAETATGLLKLELAHFDSFILETAKACRVPAGNALAVDRAAFPRLITERLREHKLIKICEKRVDRLDELGEGYRIVSTGPLTGGSFFDSLERRFGQKKLFFFDAAAPLVEGDSIDHRIAFRCDRYNAGQGDGDYLNCPLDKEQYLRFYEALAKADRAEIHDFEKKLLFSGCKPVEDLADEGIDTLRFGPLKPVGIELPEGGEAYALVQLRQDNFAGSLWNMVGFQTRLKFPEQERVFRLIPGLENARFARYGVMHRNSFLNGPELLQGLYQCREDPKLFFAGQMTGVEGYLESVASGLSAALALAVDLGYEDKEVLYTLQSRKTILGGLAAYVRTPSVDFQPMKANFSLLDPLERTEIKALRNKFGLRRGGRKEKRLAYALRSLEHLGADKEKLKRICEESVGNHEAKDGSSKQSQR